MDYYWWLKFLRRYPTLLLAPIPHILDIHQQLITSIDRKGLDKKDLITNITPRIIPSIPPPQTLEDELKLLEGYKKLLQEDLAEIQRELALVEERIKEIKELMKSSRNKNASPSK